MGLDLSGEMGSITPVRKFVWAVLIILFGVFLAVSLGVITYGITTRYPTTVVAGIVLLLMWLLLVGILWGYRRHERGRLRDLLSSNPELAPVAPIVKPKSQQPQVESKKMFCRYCGAENEYDAVFCQKCGRKMG